MAACSVRRLTDRISLIEDPHGARVPFCHCLYIDDDRRTLIDTSCGKPLVNTVKPLGVDLVLLTHFHEDHILNVDAFDEADILVHPLDADGVRTTDGFKKLTGLLDFGTPEMGQAFVDLFKLKNYRVTRGYEAKETFDLGHTEVQLVHTPGHTAGHCSFYFPQHELVYSGDIDLTRFGPYYGGLGCDADDFITSIDRLRDMQPRILVSAHRGVITEKIGERLDKYKTKIFERDEKLLAALSNGPLDLFQLGERYVFYGKPRRIELYDHFERMCVRVHMNRLIKSGLVGLDGKLYYRV